jgi:tripeptidyl-peptidase-1
LVPPWLRKLFFSNNPASTDKFDRSICNGYAAATARGVSVLFASGDVSGIAPPSLPAHALQGGVNGNHDDGFDCGLFVPVFPASCPYLTSVGSTIGFNPEVAVNFTGGGFSNIFCK